MTTDQLFNSFCLVGKIGTVHANQIKDQLKEWEKERDKEWRIKWCRRENPKYIKGVGNVLSVLAKEIEQEDKLRKEDLDLLSKIGAEILFNAKAFDYLDN